MYYIAHRLFCAHDRALGAELARRMSAEVGPEQVFLPFCDTNEEDLVADVKGRSLFDLDTERLQHLTGLLAVLHGPSLDDGVCMEIGYAAALGVPVVVLSTDFISYSLTEDGPALAFPDPLIQSIASSVVRATNLEPAEPGEHYTHYAQRNINQLTRAASSATTTLLQFATDPPPPRPPRPVVGSRSVFCEPSPYWPHPGHDPGWAALTNQLTDSGYEKVIAARLFAPDPVAAAAADWVALNEAAMLVADTSGPETPPGAALMIGACAAVGRPARAYQPRLSWTQAHGREPNWRNLMIQYAVRAGPTSPRTPDPKT